jgi:hypothetical protein
LHENLILHPQVFMPIQKELYYFNNLRGSEFHPKELQPVHPELSWYLNFFQPGDEYLAKRDEECRKWFGEPYEIAVRGEATATYAAGLDPEVVEEMLLLRPDLRVIVMVRDPIQRAWSHAKKDLSKDIGVPLASVSEEQFRSFLASEYQLKCGSYTAIIAGWRALLRPDHLFVGRYDDLIGDPTGLLDRIFTFLGLRVDPRYVSEVARWRINPTEDSAIPPNLRRELERLYADELDRLAGLGMVWP